MADNVAYTYQDFKHPTYQEILRAHSYSTIKLVRNVSEFVLKMSSAHEDFSRQVRNVVEVYQQKNVELRNERDPMNFSSSLCDAYDALLDRTNTDSQVHKDADIIRTLKARLEMADLLRTSVGKPLSELAAHKHSQLRKLFGFRENCQAIIAKAEDNLIKTAKCNVDCYQEYCSNKTARDSERLLTSYHLSHNDYALQLRATNSYEETYHNSVLPFVLQEVQELQTNLLDRLKEALETYTKTISSEAVERGLHYDGLQPGSKVNSKTDQSNFLSAILQNPVSGQYAQKQHLFSPPTNDTSATPVTTLAPVTSCDVIVSGHTEKEVKARRLSLQREAAELTSYVKQNQNVVQALNNLCQREQSNRQHGKLYEIEKDICRKSAETRFAHLQLTAIKAQLELLALRQNGTGAVTSLEGKGKRSTNAVKSMWKNAFRNLVKDDDAEDLTGSEKDAGTPSDNASPKMSAVSALMKIATKRMDGKHSLATPSQCQQNQVEPVDPIYSLLKSAAGLPSQRSAARNVNDATTDSPTPLPMNSAAAASAGASSADNAEQQESRLLGADQRGKVRLRGSAGVDRSRTGNSSHHPYGSPDRRKVSFTHQRSYSCGDLSPTDTVKGWGDENDDDWTDSGKAVEDLTTRGLQLERGDRRGVLDISGEVVRAKKGPTDRRKGWVKQKQKSKSFDFCWRSGMWSPVDDSNKVLIIVPTPRIGQCKARLKLPSMFQMDSGSSYDSYEAAEAQLTQHQRRPPVVLPLQQQPRRRPVALPEARLRREPSVSPASERDRRRPSPNRSWMLQERKSHSLDSSFDDRGYPRHEDLTPGNPGGAGPTQTGMVSGPCVGLSGIRATVRDKRLRLLHRRKSRSLDMCEPGGETDQRRHRFRDRSSGSPFHFSPIRGQYLKEAIFSQTHRMITDAPHRPDMFPRSPQHGGDSFQRRNEEDGWIGEGAEERRQRRRPTEFLSERTAERVNIIVREYKTPSPKDHHKTPSPRDIRSTSPVESSSREGGAVGWKDPRMSFFRDAYAAKDKAAGHVPATAAWDRRGLSPGRREVAGESFSPVDRERRTTFAEQKSFSYDVPSLQVRPEVQHRKQSEPIVGSCGLPPRSRGRLLPRLPIDESELGKHISQIFRFNQSVDVLQLRPSSTSLAAMGVKLGPSSSVGPQQPPPPLTVKPPVEIEVTLDEVDDKPPESSSDDTDRRKSFSEQKSFSYEVNEYFQYEQGDDDLTCGGAEVLVTNPMRDYLDSNELRQFHVDSRDLRDGGIYDGEVVRSTRRCRAMSQAFVLGGKRKGFADQKSFSYELASNPKHRACLIASARQRVLAVEGARNNSQLLRRQETTERERPSPAYQEKILAAERTQTQLMSTRGQQSETGRRRKSSVYEEGGRSGSGTQKQLTRQESDKEGGEERKVASKTGRPILEKAMTVNRHLECPHKEARRLSLSVNATGGGGVASQKSVTATVQQQRKPESAKRSEEVARCPVASDQRFPSSGDPTREQTHRRSSGVSEARRKSASTTESKKSESGTQSSEGDGDPATKSQRPRKQGGPSQATSMRLLEKQQSADSPPMSTLQIPTNTSHRAQHHKQRHQSTTGDVRGGKARASSPPPPASGDQRLQKPKDEATLSYFLSHKQQNALDQSTKMTSKKKCAETRNSNLISGEMGTDKEKERLLSANFDKEKERLLSSTHDKERPLFAQPGREKKQPLPQEPDPARDRKIADIDAAKSSQPLQERLAHPREETLPSTKCHSPKTASLLQLPKYCEPLPTPFVPFRISPTATPCSSSSNIGDDGELVSDGVVTWRRKSPDVGEMLAVKKPVGSSPRHPTARLKTDHCEGDRRDAFAHQKSFSYDVGTGQRSTDTRRGGGVGERMVQSSGPCPFQATSSPSGGWSRLRGICSARDKRVSMMDSKKSYSLDEYMSLQKQLQQEVHHAGEDQSRRLSRQAQKTSIELQHQIQGISGSRVWSPSKDEVPDSGGDPSAGGARSPATTPQRKLLLLHSMKALHDSEELARSQEEGSIESPSDSSAKSRSKKPGPTEVIPQERKTSRLPIARFFGKLKLDRKTERDSAEQRM